MGTADGALKAAAARIGRTEAEYRAKLAAGLKWCWSCGWQPERHFGLDRSRGDGLAKVCRFCKNARARERYAGRGRQ